MTDTNGAFYDNDVLESETEGLLEHDEIGQQYCSFSAKEESWQVPLSEFLSKRQGSRVKKFKSKDVRSYYEAQDALISSYEAATYVSNETVADFGAEESQSKRVVRYSQITFGVNFLLMCAKVAASVLSGSFSIISSLIESVLDLLAGVFMWWAARAIRSRDPYKYPQGRTRLEPVSILILSVVMTLASVAFIRESVTRVISLVADPTDLPIIELLVFLTAGGTVVVKFILWLVYRRVDSSIVQALALDHRNDVISNMVAILCGYLGSQEFQDMFHLQGFVYTDPGGAIFISLYIIVNWYRMGSKQIKVLAGHAAEPEILSKVTWLALNHDRRVLQLDTVRAFHLGSRLLVDVDIVLPKDMALETVHDIGESLQQKLERLGEVERAYVHVDHETSHSPASEHKLV